jgi:hypothetical protein
MAKVQKELLYSVIIMMMMRADYRRDRGDHDFVSLRRRAQVSNVVRHTSATSGGECMNARILLPRDSLFLCERMHGTKNWNLNFLARLTGKFSRHKNTTRIK